MIAKQLDIKLIKEYIVTKTINPFEYWQVNIIFRVYEIC